MDRSNPLWAAKVLGEYANHFEISDWNYTRNLGSLKSIEYNDKNNSLRNRLKRAISYLRGEDDYLMAMIQDRPVTWRDRWRMAVFSINFKEKNLPDGRLDNGAILTFWEETGEYLQLVQPSVGNLLAEFLLDQPENPHAQKISKEIVRILDAYEERVNKEKNG